MGASLFVYYWEVRLDEYYELYMKCFPEYPTTPKVFSAKLRPELAHIVERGENGKLVGFTFVHSGPIPLLCVESRRGRGTGSGLLEECEGYPGERGYAR